MDTPIQVVLGAPLARPPFPYPGLRPFESDEWQIFFGRETMIDEVIDRIAREHLVLIHGASGSGKSSLVRAGVLPKLARQHLRHGTPWLTCDMRPSGGPLWSLATEFARLEGHPGDVARITEIMRLFNRRDATLAGVVKALPALAGKRLCILVDQFEELFRFERETSREEAELFVDLLIGALPQPGGGDTNLHVILTMRSEFLGECARFDGFAEAVNRTQYLVPPLTQPALMRAIQQPARLYGGEVTPELAERLIADVRGKQDELPLIQHGLMLFWHAAVQANPEAKVVLDTHLLGRGAGLAQLLSDHADRVMQEAAPAPADKLVVERLFRALTDVNAEGQAIRRPQSFQTLLSASGATPETLLRIIDAFRAEGVSFLTPYFPAAITDRTVIDVSHEALIRYWRAIADPQLGWLRREADDGMRWRSLLFEAKEYEQDRKRLLSTATTTERERWMAERSADWSERYGGQWPAVERFLQACRKSIVRRRRVRRLWVIPVVTWTAVAPVVLLNTRLFGAFKGDIDIFDGVIGIGLLTGIAVTLLLIAVDYGTVLVRRIKRRGPAPLPRQTRRNFIPAWLRRLNPQPATRTRLRKGWYVLLAVAYLGGLGYIFRDRVAHPARFDLRVGDAAYDSNIYDKALAWYLRAAKRGNPEAQFDVGYMYDHGYGVAKDYKQAMLWFRRSADQGYAKGEGDVGTLFRDGLGVPQDYAQALFWFRKAADQSDAFAQNEVGVLYYDGSGVTKDYKEAMTWFQKAAANGNAAACGNIGLLFENGEGVAEDYLKAMVWYQKAAARHDAAAYDNIGYMFEHGLGVPRDYVKAMQWYNRAADQGTAAAQYHIATLYEGGLGVPKDENRALEWMLKAANAGEERAKDWLSKRFGGH